MKALELLKKYQKKFEPVLKAVFKEKIERARRIDPLAEDTIKAIEKFVLAGGKRIRPAIMYYGYLASGGEDNDEIVRTSASIELTHAFLLIHDDIIDKDEKRHNVPTVHERYRKRGILINRSRDSVHFGNSMALLVGDAAYCLAGEIIFNSKFPSKLIVKGLDKLQEIVYKTIPGQMVDIMMEMKGKATEEEVLRMHDGKTARYTFEGPLHLGCILANAGTEKNLKHFSDYAIPLGKAFQIRDDILGAFGDEEKLGKPVGSDIIEGKQTLLVVKANELGNQKQRKIINSLLGKEKISKKELETFRDVVRETGSLDYSYQLAHELVQQAVAALNKIEFKNKEAEIFLRGIADYIVKRQK